MPFLTTILDVVLPPSGALALLFIGPMLAFYKITKWLVSLVVHEDVRGKVVLITGASSGIGENITYQYAKRGARLVLVARREAQLTTVADRAVAKGASDVKVIVGDVTKEEECKRFIDETIAKYGRLDHLVNNAGVAHSFLFEEAGNLEGMTATMDTTFWGNVYTTHFALPHLRASKGKILVIASVASWIPYPRQSLYNAAKAAILAFYDTLRVELGSAVGITIVMPGWVESEMTKGKLLSDDGELSVKRGLRDHVFRYFVVFVNGHVKYLGGAPDGKFYRELLYERTHLGPLPVAYTEECARAAVNGVIGGRHYVQIPFFYSVFLLYRVVAPEILELMFNFLYVMNKEKPLSKKVMEVTKASTVMYPSSIQKQE